MEMVGLPLQEQKFVAVANLLMRIILQEVENFGPESDQELVLKKVDIEPLRDVRDFAFFFSGGK